jgi:hypothetical protein
MTNAILLVQTISIFILGSLVIGLLRSHGRLLKLLHDAGFDVEAAGHAPAQTNRRVAPTTTGRQAVDVGGSTLAGAATTVSLSETSHPTLLAFLSTGCSSCQVFWREMDSASRSLPGNGTRLVVVTKGPEAESPSRLRQLAPPGVKLVQSNGAWDDYEVPVTPYFVLVDGGTSRVVGEGSANSWSQVFSLLGQALADVSVDRSRPVRFGRSGDSNAEVELRKAGIGPGHESLRPPGSP